MRRPLPLAFLAVLGLALVAALGVATAARAQPAPPPAPTRWVTDGAGMLSSAARDAIDRKLAAYDKQTGHQVIVWIGDSIGNEPLDDWSARTFAAWKIGRKGQDDGLVLFILAKD